MNLHPPARIITDGTSLACTLLAALALGGAAPATQDLPLISSKAPQHVLDDPDLLSCFVASRNPALQEFLELGMKAQRSTTEETRYQALHVEYGALDYGELGKLYARFGEQYGINGFYAFLQMLHETGYLKYGGEADRGLRNFAGLGADGFWTRQRDGEKLRVIEEQGEWRGRTPKGRTAYRFTVPDGTKLRPGTVLAGHDQDVYLQTRPGNARPMVRQPGEDWTTGDRFATTAQGVEAHVQHLALYAGTMPSGKPLHSAKSRSSRAHLGDIDRAWRAQHGRPIGFGDIGQRIRLRPQDDPSSVWAWKRDPDDYANSLRGLASDFETWRNSDAAHHCACLLQRPKAAGVWRLTGTFTAEKPIPPERLNWPNGTKETWTSSPTELTYTWRQGTEDPAHYRFTFKIGGSPPAELSLGQRFELDVTCEQEVSHWGVPSSGLHVYSRHLKVAAEDGRGQMRVEVDAETPQGTGCKFLITAPKDASAETLELWMNAHAGSWSNVRWVYKRVEK